jgi:hypothetical protein
MERSRGTVCFPSGDQPSILLYVINIRSDFWKLEASLVCEHCRGEAGRRAQAYIIGLAETKPRETGAAAATRQREISPLEPATD